MSISVTGIRNIPATSNKIVQKVMETFVAAYPNATFFFGGAIGSDTLALMYAAKAKAACCTVIVPFTVSQQPLEARQAIIKYADKICELKLPNTKSAFFERNNLVVKRGKILLGFTDGRETGGTWYTINRGRKENKLVIPILV